jgi:hypothetical protein
VQKVSDPSKTTVWNVQALRADDGEALTLIWVEKIGDGPWQQRKRALTKSEAIRVIEARSPDDYADLIGYVRKKA